MNSDACIYKGKDYVKTREIGRNLLYIEKRLVALALCLLGMAGQPPRSKPCQAIIPWHLGTRVDALALLRNVNSFNTATVSWELRTDYSHEMAINMLTSGYYDDTILTYLSTSKTTRIRFFSVFTSQGLFGTTSTMVNSVESEVSYSGACNPINRKLFDHSM